MVEKVKTATISGARGVIVEVECDVSTGLPATIIVGLPDTLIQESKERVRSSIKQGGFQYPAARVSINLSPGNLRKTGTHFDMAIAIAILQSAKLIKVNTLNDKIFIGELSLSGEIKPCSGVLPMVIEAKRSGIKEVFVSSHDAFQASLVEGISVYSFSKFSELVLFLIGKAQAIPYAHNFAQDLIGKPEANMLDFADISGQSYAKRALEVAAAGGHNVLLTGPPGSGKTMLAKAFSGILPKLSQEEFIEVVSLYSLVAHAGAKHLPENTFSRPFRSPHHTSSAAAIIGGGAYPRPGEVSLAHNGVLFMDEFPEFSKQVLEVLRQPLEEGVANISRAKQSFSYPAKFILVASQNPCPCGNFGDPLLVCKCHPGDVIKYSKKISGPILDRIDLHITVPRLKYSEFANQVNIESSASIRVRVNRARNIQLQRNSINCDLTNQQIKKICNLDSELQKLLEKASDMYALSGRSINRILKVARTIADLSNSDNIKKQHLLESLHYRLPETTL